MLANGNNVSLIWETHVPEEGETRIEMHEALAITLVTVQGQVNHGSPNA
jgi:hypothetical protein